MRLRMLEYLMPVMRNRLTAGNQMPAIITIHTLERNPENTGVLEDECAMLDYGAKVLKNLERCVQCHQ